MDAEELFRQRLKGAAGDTTLRLVFADWLEEHGKNDEAIVQRYVANHWELGDKRRLRGLAPSVDMTLVGKSTEEAVLLIMKHAVISYWGCRFIKAELFLKNIETVLAKDIDNRLALAALYRTQGLFQDAKDQEWIVRALRGEFDKGITTIKDYAMTKTPHKRLPSDVYWAFKRSVAVVVYCFKPLSEYGLWDTGVEHSTQTAITIGNIGNREIVKVLDRHPQGYISTILNLRAI